MCDNADFSFVIPVTRDELPANVSELLRVAEVQEKLQACRSSLKHDGPDFILAHFDVLFSSLFCFGELEMEDKRQIFNIASDGLEKLHAELCLRLNDDEMVMENDDRKRLLNVVKMLCYIVCKVVEAFETESSTVSSKNIQSNKKTRKNAKKSKSSTRLTDGGWDLDSNILHVMKSLDQLCALPIHLLWNPPIPEEEFVNLLGNTCYKLLENPDRSRQEQLKTVMFHLLGQMISKFKNLMACSLKIVQLLQYHEHLVVPLAQAIIVFTTEYNVTEILGEIIREMETIQSQDASCDSASSRAFAGFLVEIARTAPAVLKSNMHLLASYLDGESYSMVNCVLNIMAEIILSVTKNGEEMDRRTRIMRDKFMDELQKHIHDIHAFVRSKCLQIWTRLSEEQAIPLRRRRKITFLAKGRLLDKTPMVRKNAMQLLTACLANNPFAPTLKLEELRAKLEVEKKKLFEMQPELADEPDQESEEDCEDEEEQEDEQVTIPECNELTNKKNFVNYLKDCIAFTVEIHDAMSVVSQLMRSSNASDVLESIKFSITAHKFGISHSTLGIQKMLLLIFSEEPAVRESVVNAFKSLYIESCSADEIVKNLITLTTNATIGEMFALEQLIPECMQSRELPNRAFSILWTIFKNEGGKYAIGEMRSAIRIIGMAAKCKPDLVKNNLGYIVEFGLGPQAVNDFQFARDVCLAILKIADGPKDDAGNKNPIGKFQADCNLIKRLIEILVVGLQCPTDDAWIPFAEHAVKVIYTFTQNPAAILGKILKDVHAIIVPDPSDLEATCEAFMLKRYMSLVGMTACHQLVHLDVTVFGEMKRRNALKALRRQKPNSSRARLHNAKSLEETYDAIEEELGLAGSDDADAEYISRICDERLVTGPNLLAFFGPTILAICSDPGKFNDPHLFSLATVALAKFMLVSANFCETRLSLLFTILEKCKSAAIRCNLLFGIADLYRRFPNLVEPWSSHLYKRLTDDDLSVRRCTVTVLSKLILNDMIKLRGQISELALLYVDDDETIVRVVENLFAKLSQKDNAIYNVMPDLISNLSDPARKVDEDHFRMIMKLLLGFVQKDRQVEGLLEKCCQRLAESQNKRQCCDLSYCILLLSTSEKCVQKLCNNFSLYSDKLVEPELYQLFMSIVAALRKIVKVDMKSQLDDLEDKIEDCHKKGNENRAVLQNVKGRKGNASKNTGRKAPKRQESRDSDDSDFTEQSFNKPPARKSRKNPESVLASIDNKVASNKAAIRRAKLAKILASSDSDSPESASDSENIPRRVTQHSIRCNSTK